MASVDPLDLHDAERRQAEQADAARLAELLENQDVTWVMSDRRGRRFVYRLLEAAGVWRSSFNTNALSMAFNEGERNAGLRLLAKVASVTPRKYQDMLREGKE